MEDIIVFIGLSTVCLGFWYGVAWLDQWQGDQQLKKKYNKKQGD